MTTDDDTPLCQYIPYSRSFDARSGRACADGVKIKCSGISGSIVACRDPTRISPGADRGERLPGQISATLPREHNYK